MTTTGKVGTRLAWSIWLMEMCIGRVLGIGGICTGGKIPAWIGFWPGKLP